MFNGVIYVEERKNESEPICEEKLRIFSKLIEDTSSQNQEAKQSSSRKKKNLHLYIIEKLQEAKDKDKICKDSKKRKDTSNFKKAIIRLTFNFLEKQWKLKDNKLIANNCQSKILYKAKISLYQQI